MQNTYEIEELVKLISKLPGLGPKSAKRIIVQAQVGSGAGLKLQGGLILHNTDGSFTEKAEMVLRKCYALDLTGSC